MKCNGLTVYFVSLLILMLWGAPSAAQNAGQKNDRSTRFWLVVAEESSVLRVSAYGKSPEATDTLTYHLEVARIGEAGSSVSRQSGAFVLTAEKEKQLSQSSVNLAMGEECSAHLRVFAGERCIADIEKVYTLSGKTDDEGRR